MDMLQIGALVILGRLVEADNKTALLKTVLKTVMDPTGGLE